MLVVSILSLSQSLINQLDYHAPIGDLAKFYVNGFEDVKARSDVYLKVISHVHKKLNNYYQKVKRFVEYLGLVKMKA